MKFKRNNENSISNLGYYLLNEYKGKFNQIRVIIRDEVGYKYDINLNNILRGDVPRFVDKNNPYTLENIILWLKINRSEFKLCEGNRYNGNKSKLKFYHKTCQDYVEISWNNLYRGWGCGICHGLQTGRYNSLAHLRSDLADEWDYERNELKPEEVTCGSNKKVWWICCEGHEYFASPNSRTSMNTGCRECSDKAQDSKVAKEVKEWSINSFENVDIEHKMFINPETNRWLKCDVYIGKKESYSGIYIEIHGRQHYTLSYFHKLTARKHDTTPEEVFEHQKKLDKTKKKFAIKNGTYIEVDLRKIKTTKEAIKYIELNIN